MKISKQGNFLTAFFTTDEYIDIHRRLGSGSTRPLCITAEIIGATSQLRFNFSSNGSSDNRITSAGSTWTVSLNESRVNGLDLLVDFPISNVGRVILTDYGTHTIQLPFSAFKTNAPRLVTKPAITPEPAKDSSADKSKTLRVKDLKVAVAAINSAIAAGYKLKLDSITGEIIGFKRPDLDLVEFKKHEP